ncbi:MAG: hypothetical protein Q9173_005589 [Seirophora scorigena]
MANLGGSAHVRLTGIKSTRQPSAANFALWRQAPVEAIDVGPLVLQLMPVGHLASSVRDTSLTFDPPLPRIPGLETSFTLDHSRSLRPLEVYQTGIELMYDLAQRDWMEVVLAVIIQQIEGFNVLMMFLNPQPPNLPNQLQIRHCVFSLYRALTVMTDGVLFCQLRCKLKIHSLQVGALSIAPLDDKRTVAADDPSMSMPDEQGRLVGADSGQLVDDADPKFVINYLFYGKSINSKEVSMGVVEAMATAAPFDKNSECKELTAVSPDGGCGIFIESVPGSRQTFAYKHATRALKLLYQKIIVRQRRFGDLYLDLRYDGQRFGELRMLKFVGGVANATDAVAEAR